MTTRFLREPSAPEIHRRLQVTGNVSVGLVRFKGILGGERVVVTSDRVLGEILRHPDLYQIPPHRRSLISQLTGDGLLVTNGETHKVGRLSEWASL